MAGADLYRWPGSLLVACGVVASWQAVAKAHQLLAETAWANPKPRPIIALGQLEVRPDNPGVDQRGRKVMGQSSAPAAHLKNNSPTSGGS